MHECFPLCRACRDRECRSVTQEALSIPTLASKVLGDEQQQCLYEQMKSGRVLFSAYSKRSATAGEHSTEAAQTRSAMMCPADEPHGSWLGPCWRQLEAAFCSARVPFRGAGFQKCGFNDDCKLSVKLTESRLSQRPAERRPGVHTVSKHISSTQGTKRPTL